MSKQPKPESPSEMGKRLIEEKEQQQKQQNQAAYTLAERLMQSVVADTVDVPFKDSQGEFTVTCRRFTRSERNQVTTLFAETYRAVEDAKKTKTAVNPTEQAEREKKFLALLAYPSGVCLDDALDMNFWLKGDYPENLAVHILNSVSVSVAKATDAAESFRKN